jgi:hypothetical protein
MDVLDAALAAIGADKRFRSVTNGHFEVAWRQPRKTKDDEAPARYFVGIEFAFDPERRGD